MNNVYCVCGHLKNNHLMDYKDKRMEKMDCGLCECKKYVKVNR